MLSLLTDQLWAITAQGHSLCQFVLFHQIQNLLKNLTSKLHIVDSGE
jgi:hypothetical protein